MPEQKIETTEEFDVFLCHNSEDKPEVKKIAEQLRKEGLKPWLDVEQLRPGESWQDSLERQIKKIKSAAVFVGSNGFGPWQKQEMKAFLNQFVNRNCPVIPTLLPNAPQQPELPIFLTENTWVDFRQSDPDPLGQLYWGITDKRLEKKKQNDPQPEPIPDIPAPPNYQNIIDDFCYGIDPDSNSGVIPFLGAGIDLCSPKPISPIEIASKLAELYSEGWIGSWIGVPCSDCPQKRKPGAQEEQPIPDIVSIDLQNKAATTSIKLQNKAATTNGQSISIQPCALSGEQQLSLAKINLRLLSQHYRLKSRSRADNSQKLYNKIHQLFDDDVNHISQHQYNQVHRFWATLPKELKKKGYKQLPYQLILTTSYDDRLERAFQDEDQPFDLIYYVAEGIGRGQFKHQSYEEFCEGKEGTVIINGSDYEGTRKLPWNEHPIILKLYGTWTDKFVITEEHHINYLSNSCISNLPVKLLNAIKDSYNRYLLLGYSLSDSDLELILNRFSGAEHELEGGFFIVHQSSREPLERERWAKRKVDDYISSSVEDCIQQLENGIKKLPKNRN